MAGRNNFQLIRERDQAEKRRRTRLHQLEVAESISLTMATVAPTADLMDEVVEAPQTPQPQLEQDHMGSLSPQGGNSPVFDDEPFVYNESNPRCLNYWQFLLKIVQWIESKRQARKPGTRITFGRTILRLAKYLSRGNDQSIAQINQDGNEEAGELGHKAIYPDFSHIVARRLTDVKLKVVSKRFTISHAGYTRVGYTAQLDDPNGMRDLLGRNISKILMSPGAALLCKKRVCASLYDVVDGSTYTAWTDFFHTRPGMNDNIVRIPLRLYSDGTAKRNLDRVEIHVFRLCLLIGGRCFFLPNFAECSMDLAYMPTGITTTKDGLTGKVSFTGIERQPIKTALNKQLHDYMLDCVLQQLSPVCKEPFPIVVNDRVEYAICELQVVVNDSKEKEKSMGISNCAWCPQYKSLPAGELPGARHPDLDCAFQRNAIPTPPGLRKDHAFLCIEAIKLVDNAMGRLLDMCLSCAAVYSDPDAAVSSKVTDAFGKEWTRMLDATAGRIVYKRTEDGLLDWAVIGVDAAAIAQTRDKARSHPKVRELFDMAEADSKDTSNFVLQRGDMFSRLRGFKRFVAIVLLNQAALYPHHERARSTCCSVLVLSVRLLRLMFDTGVGFLLAELGETMNDLRRAVLVLSFMSGYDEPTPSIHVLLAHTVESIMAFGSPKLHAANKDETMSIQTKQEDDRTNHSARAQEQVLRRDHSRSALEAAAHILAYKKGMSLDELRQAPSFGYGFVFGDRKRKAEDLQNQHSDDDAQSDSDNASHASDDLNESVVNTESWTPMQSLSALSSMFQPDMALNEIVMEEYEVPKFSLSLSVLDLNRHLGVNPFHFLSGRVFAETEGDRKNFKVLIPSQTIESFTAEAKEHHVLAFSPIARTEAHQNSRQSLLCQDLNGCGQCLACSDVEWDCSLAVSRKWPDKFGFVIGFCEVKVAAGGQTPTEEHAVLVATFEIQRQYGFLDAAGSRVFKQSEMINWRVERISCHRIRGSCWIRLSAGKVFLHTRERLGLW